MAYGSVPLSRFRTLPHRYCPRCSSFAPHRHSRDRTHVFGGHLRWRAAVYGTISTQVAIHCDAITDREIFIKLVGEQRCGMAPRIASVLYRPGEADEVALRCRHDHERKPFDEDRGSSAVGALAGELERPFRGKCINFCREPRPSRHGDRSHHRSMRKGSALHNNRAHRKQRRALSVGLQM